MSTPAHDSGDGTSPSRPDDRLPQSAGLTGGASRPAANHWPMAAVLIALIVGVVAFIGIQAAKEAARSLPDGVGAAMSGMARIAERFNSSHITHTFTESLPELSTPEGGNLEVAMIRVIEDVEESDTRFVGENSVLRNYFTSISAIRVPVTYRYHIRLNDDWQLETEGQTCIVHAPELRPSLPPAIHTEDMVKRSDEGTLRLNAKEQMQELERSLTPAFSRLAADERHLDLVRDKARRVVADFIRNWLLREEHWSSNRFHSVIVVFPDEDGLAERAGPTITLDDEELSP